MDGLSPKHAPKRWSVASIARIAVIPAIIGVVIGSGVLGRSVPQDPYARAAEEVGAEIAEIPAFDARFGKVDPDAAFEIGAELGARAIARLPDDDLIEWLTITRQLLGNLDIEACATAVRGPSDAEEALDVFRALDLETYRRYLDIVVSAVRAELSGTVMPPPPADSEIEAAVAELGERLGAQRLREIQGVMLAPATAADAELCSAGRDLYDGIAELDSGSRATLMRIVMPAGPSA